MLTAKGNPTMDSLTDILHAIKKYLNIKIQIHAVPAS